MIRLPKYNNKSVGVFGLGAAGKAAIEALVQSGAHVYAWDDSETTRNKLRIDVPTGKSGQLTIEHNAKWPWAELACVVLSPGVPLTHPKPHPVVDMARRERVKIMGEVDLLYEACPLAHYVGITGTNGKSTTTALITHILCENGLQAQAGANLGVPALALNDLGEKGIYVLEMSSYQLDLVQKVVFNASILMNITPDHLDRHGGMEGYIKAKRRIFERQQDKHASFVGLDDGYCRDIYIDLVREHRANIVPFTVTQHQPMNRGIEVDDNGVLHDKYSNKEYTYNLMDIERLKGRHNWQNIAAAYGVARYFNLAPDAIMQAVHSFPGLPHRMELVTTISNVTFVNDSKATNADAVARALEPFDNIYWILGGVQKAGGIEPLASYFSKIKHAFLIGEAQDAFAATLQGKVVFTKCGDLENATHMAAKMAFRDATEQSVVLLSPACASFDQWKNFEARGDAFRQYARDIATKGI